MISIIFWFLALLSCGFVWLHGQADGRRAVGLFLVATLLTWGAQTLDTKWQQTHWPLMAVDTAYLVAAYVFALRSDRYWPLWIAAFQLLTVATHVATIIAPDYLPKIYSAIATFWVVPLLLSMVAGVYLDHRAFQRLVPPQ
ncbi:hypothetical protein [Blastomonas sp. UPD001]|jgi:hypothetical protein|uniref:hypothetical protein n=1 Tax=Blastomonas sp. UPD001 TaxID=2217673 RepID=UPI000E355090|nr:hypothetical protein [Blastomonas sp. UPD001]